MRGKTAGKMGHFAPVPHGTALGVEGGEDREVRPMRRIQMSSMVQRAAAAGGLGALLMTVGCGATQGSTAFRAQDAAAAPATAPVVVSCEPNQRTLVRPSV